jgi:hypothetical protein
MLMREFAEGPGGLRCDAPPTARQRTAAIERCNKGLGPHDRAPRATMPSPRMDRSGGKVADVPAARAARGLSPCREGRWNLVTASPRTMQRAGETEPRPDSRVGAKPTDRPTKAARKKGRRMRDRLSR